MNDERRLTHLLAQLSDAKPDPRHSARVQTRCRAALARRTAQTTPPPARRLESLCVVGLCVAYLISVIQYALQ